MTRMLWSWMDTSTIIHTAGFICVSCFVIVCALLCTMEFEFGKNLKKRLRNHGFGEKERHHCSHALVLMQPSSVSVIICKIWCLQQLPWNHIVCMEMRGEWFLLVPPHDGGNVMVTCAGNCVLIRFSFSQLFSLE